MKIKVHLRNPHDGAAQVFVVIDASAEQGRFVFENPAMKQVVNKDQPVKTSCPNLTYDAIESAFQSGAFYARHRVKAKALFARLLSFGWEGKVENAIPFAVATTVAIYEAVAGIRDYTEKDLSGWEVVTVERE